MISIRRSLLIAGVIFFCGVSLAYTSLHERRLQRELLRMEVNCREVTQAGNSQQDYYDYVVYSSVFRPDQLKKSVAENFSNGMDLNENGIKFASHRGKSAKKVVQNDY